MDEKQINRKNLIMFPLGTVGRDMVYALVTNFLLTYVLFTRELTANRLFVVKNYAEGQKSKPEYGINCNNSTLELLEEYNINKRGL